MIPLFFFMRQKKVFNKALKILLATNSIILLAGAMLGPIYALFVEQIGGDLLDASFVGGTFALTAGITTLVSGRYVDKIKRKELIVIIGYVIMATGFLSLIFVETIWMLLIVQVIIGLGEAIYSPAFDAVYSKHLRPNMAGREWSAWESMNYFTAAAGALIGGFIAYKYGFDALFVVMAVISFLSALYILVLPRKTL